MSTIPPHFSKNWICAQIGAREHYAIPRTLYAHGKLKRLYTDFWATSAWRGIGRIAGQSGLVTRYHSDLQGAPVSSFNVVSMSDNCRKYGNSYERFLHDGEAFGSRVRAALNVRNTSVDPRLVFFGYDTGFLEPAVWVRERGGKTIVCQIDPSRFETDLVRAEELRWQGWSKTQPVIPEAYFHRREEEWETADLVMVNSEWSRQALVRQGVDSAKIVVVPLAYETGNPRAKNENDWSLRTDSCFTRARPLRVLFLGQVILRKGIQYLIEAARMLKEEPIRFDVVGAIGISDEAMDSAPHSMTFHGAVSRDQTENFYENSDLFVFPTLSDGFGLTQLEAMARGLPVIATPSCGEVVTDRLDGLIVPPGDANALAEAMQLILQDPSSLREMSTAALGKVSQFGFDRLASNLGNIGDRLG